MGERRTLQVLELKFWGIPVKRHGLYHGQSCDVIDIPRYTEDVIVLYLFPLSEGDVVGNWKDVWLNRKTIVTLSERGSKD